MRTWTMSACCVLASSILSIVLLTSGMTGSVPPAQASARTARSTEITLVSSTHTTLASDSKIISTSTPGRAADPATAPRPQLRYIVQSGDTLSAIAARFAVRGGWPALFAANRATIGPDPDAIHPGAVLVLPGPHPPGRYTVRTGDTLSSIAAELAVPGGWPALYTANRRVIGPDPNALRPGTVLRTPRPAASAPGRPGHVHQPRPAHRPRPAQPARPASPPSAPAATRPASGTAPHPAGMPGWLKAVLLCAALFVLVGFLAEPVLMWRQRRRRAAGQAPAPADSGRQAGHGLPADSGSPAGHGPLAASSGGQAGRPLAGSPLAGSPQPGSSQPERPQTGAPQPGRPQPDPVRPRIVLADHDRLVVTRDRRDETVYVLRPPGADPRAVLRVARLVLAEERYGELARQLGLPGLGPVDR
jgi:LysM repeat protein